ncbi:GNAT family N-acetyltransferase [Acetivibrio cellulolyticus]|uniref:GNAT family N-acetyltransferase n=1 Tax=Acetivibrio cellulolyticus TaxID=35830 RepID=UPI0001E2F570|nr:GNAT family N-acetyltransferase [Acetivibrio cellulolyticus]
MYNLSERLKTELTKMGASLVGFADLRDLPENQRDGFNYGISIAVALDPAIINGLGNGPTKEYYDEYKRINSLLDSLDIKAGEIIKDGGFNALPKTRANVSIEYKDHSTILPHKTVATRAGIGWIGKSALLVTEKYGSAVRISSVLTDAPLEVDKPVNQSNCGTCDNCVRNCPAGALSGDLWFAGKERETFYNYKACRNKAIERTWRISPGETHCGLCILVCPKTKNYISSSGIKYSFPSVDIAVNGDLEEILVLQKLAYQENASRYNDYEISPLMQTLKDLQEEAKSKIILKVVQDRRIVGSVRAFEKDGTCYIGKLIVHPDYQNRGIGKKLVGAIEKCFGGVRYELFTGHLDEKNLSFYSKLGYKTYKTECVSDELKLIYLEK